MPPRAALGKLAGRECNSRQCLKASRSVCPIRPKPHSAPRATACAPTRCPLRSSASAPSRPCRTWLASLGHRTESCLSLIDVVASVGFAGSEEQFQLIASAVERNPKHAEPVVRLLDRDHL